ncbi:LacI family DNA-binding transcriptional regulator [Acidipropionibacterium virtanenii]|uniref:HTH-type transcriptional repressor CytR n=1 Tax=Acidipropionibacterium virtanenii TaxID=2057246 RepID=A0A344UWQ5_9ACTN|nr:LacI family DNA-binding transcriptional regulator [Acidipropionibacterium virtanenii]AXE39703.1 HTH-type transcriptional repressor CytR [Acidipropionibacterium virtanenii]
MPKPVTLKAVAARVGVTPAAASMALKGSPRISEATREAVELAAKELGYVPNAAGRNLRNRHAGAIALVVPNSSVHVFSHQYFMHVLSGMTIPAAAHDAQVIVSTNAETASGDMAYERIIRSQAADGIISTSSSIDDEYIHSLVGTGLPVVLLGNYPDLPDAVTIWIDDTAASRQITEHLIADHGCQRLLHVAGSLDHQTGIDRRQGFLDAAASAGIETADVIEGDMNEESGAAAMRTAIVDGALPYDGIVFANDDMAVGALPVLRDAGIRIPEDVRITGFDDFGVARLTTPDITTIRVPAQEIAGIAAETLFDLIANGRHDNSSQRLPVSTTYRHSCGCTPDNA